MAELWHRTDLSAWRGALARYPDVVASQGVAALPDLDRWYRDDLPLAIQSRRPSSVTLPELVRTTEWKMARGVWRAPNLALVRANTARDVIATSETAMAEIPHLTTPVATLASLDGVGPATASAVLAAAAPAIYPFFDELVAGQVPALGKLGWTLRFYALYATALRDRATALGALWTPVMVERALWAHVGGKKGPG
ncbi:MAG: hypothetical protein NVS1B4_13630 [Gemmatimonadaceae bacterium]